eukprot:jgi/Tetstr1/455570/TSEL_042389.t1
MIRGITIEECLIAAMSAGETLFAAQFPQGYCGERFECFIGDKGVLGESSFEEVADQQCKGERWTGAYNGVAATYLGSGNRNAVYMIVPPLPMGDPCPNEAPPSDTPPSPQTTNSSLPTLEYGYCGERFECFIGDKGLLGESSFEEVADQQCKGERWTGAYNGVAATYLGSGNRNAVYMIVPPLPMGPLPPTAAEATSPHPGIIGGVVAVVVVALIVGIAFAFCRRMRTRADDWSAPEPDLALDALVPWQNVPLHPEHIGYEVFNLHVTLPADLSKPPLRLLHIQAVIHRWEYAGDPMVEIHRSRLYYARARAMIVLPGFRQLSREPRRVWTLAERMARHARREKLRQWLSLDIWLGMVVDAMLGGKGDAAAAIYWQKMFPTAVLQELSKGGAGRSSWRRRRHRDWLKTYLLEEAGEIYSAFNSNDVVWSIYCFFCYDHDVTATKALRKPVCRSRG